MEKLISIFRKEHFNAAHRLHVNEWTAQENKDFFGPCNNENYHGHNYDLIVKLTGPIDPVTGYCFDMKALSTILKKEVLYKFDHKNLNLDTEEFKNLNPSAENIAVVIYDKLRAQIENKFKIEITLYETERNFVHYAG